MKPQVTSTRIEPEKLEKLKEIADKEKSSVSKVISDLIDKYLNQINEIDDLKQKVEMLELDNNQLLENQKIFFEKYIMIDIRKIQIDTLAFWLECKEFNNLNEIESTFDLISSNFQKAFGKVEKKYIEQATNIKKELNK